MPHIVLHIQKGNAVVVHGVCKVAAQGVAVELWQSVTFELFGEKVFYVAKVKPAMRAGKQGIIIGLSAFMEVSTDGFVHSLVNHRHNVGAVSFGFPNDYHAIIGDVVEIQVPDFANTEAHVGHEGEHCFFAQGRQVLPYLFYLLVRGALLEGFVGAVGFDNAFDSFG